MNSYYHAFVPGFNWWYVFSALFVIAMAFIGTAMYRMDESLRIRRCNRKILTVASVFFAAIIFIMISCESSQGIVQYFDNGLSANESPFYSLLAAGTAVMLLSVLYALLLNAVGVVAAWAKYGYLIEKRNEERKKLEQKKNPRA